MRLCNDGDFSDASWEPASNTRYWSLDSGDGVKTVHVQVKDVAGLVSQPFSDSVVLDTSAPQTSCNYSNVWHASDFNIQLTALDLFSNNTETYYRVNSGPLLNLTANGLPFISEERRNNTLEYWSVDLAGNVETPHILPELKLDKTAPTAFFNLSKRSIEAGRRNWTHLALLTRALVLLLIRGIWAMGQRLLTALQIILILGLAPTTSP